METVILIAIGIFVGGLIAGPAFTRPPRETIVVVPVETTEQAPERLGCLPLIAVAVLILLFLSSH